LAFPLIAAFIFTACCIFSWAIKATFQAGRPWVRWCDRNERNEGRKEERKEGREGGRKEGRKKGKKRLSMVYHYLL
jgi:hypothetical protein